MGIGVKGFYILFGAMEKECNHLISEAFYK
jgi:hypothetical protein